MTGVDGPRPAAASAPPADRGAATDDAHDFNNLLCTINNHASLIMDDLEPQDPRYESAAEIRLAASLAAELVDRLLAAGRPPAAAASPATELAGAETVLVVESDAKMLPAVAGLLARHGYTVLPASTPDEAGRLAAEHPGDIHLLLAVGWLPEAQGRVLAAQLTAQRPGLKTLFAAAPGGSASGAPVADIVTRLARPFTAETLLQRIRALLEGKSELAVLRAEETACRQAEQRLEQINACLLGLGPDFAANINRLTALCGELLGASSALYNRLDGGMLCALGQWHTPPDFDPQDRPDGHICYDVIRQDGRQALVVRNLSATAYAASDPNVVRYGLQTYVGHPVYCAGRPVGSLCVVFQRDLEPTADDLRALGIIASSLGGEEERRAAVTALRESEYLYRQLFENMLNGFAYCRILLEQGRPHDFVYVQTNSAFEALTGLRDVAGKKVSEVIPGILESDPELIQTYGRVALSGQPESFEIHLKSLDMWFAVSVYCPQREHFVAVFDVITERKRAEKALRESEGMLRKAQGVARLGSWIWHIPTNRLEWSDEMFRIFGLTRAAFTGDLAQVVAGAIHPDDRAAVEEANRAVLEMNKPRPLEYRVVWPDGTVHTVWAEAGELVLDAEGRALTLTGIVQDITERKQVEASLRQTSDFLENLLDHTHAPIVVWDPQLRITRFNHAFELLTARTAAEVIGQPIDILFPPYAVQSSLANIDEAVSGDSWKPIELEIAQKHGMVYTVVWNVATIYAADGKTPVATIAQGQDITDRKLVELELRESQRRLYNIINNIPDLVWLKDRDGHFIVVNKPFGRACGRRAEELPGLTDLDVWPPDLAERYRADDREVVASGKRKQVEEPLADQTGQSHWIETIRTPIRDETGAITGTAGIARDITRRKKLQQEQAATITESLRAYRKLQETQQQLVHTEKLAAVGTMISGLAHELNNPLAGVIGYAELLQDAGLDSQAREDVAEIVGNAKRCKKIIDNLLIFSRKHEPQRVQCDLNEAVRQAYALKARDIELDGIRVELALHPDLPKTSADIHQLEQVFLNLINNAHHALLKVEPPRRLRLASQVNATGELAFTVENNGPPIPSEVLNRIFEPFFTTKDVGQGTGLGLAISYGIIYEHGGTITVASTIEAGTVFTITIPVDLTVAAPARAESAAPAPASRSVRALIIDDEKPILRVMRRIVESGGGEAVTCESPAEAAVHVRRGGFDVIFCDFRFPGEQDGFAAHDLFRAECPDRETTNFILMSGQSADMEIVAEAGRRGIRFLAKPFARDEVIGLLAGRGRDS